MAWQKVPINSFLKERPDRFSPEEANRLGLHRIEKIDFSGNIHVNKNKLTNTGMILVKNGDLVISGINIEKGAVAVYQGAVDVIATIHYSSYIFDRSKIDIQYFTWFLKNQTFKDVINSQTRGGIKTELKPKMFLPLIIDLPDLKTQIQIRENLNSVSNEIREMISLQYSNESFALKLRQVIFSQAVSGKLVSQDPKESSALEFLNKIEIVRTKLLNERKIKKIKPLVATIPEEMPYPLPQGWEWVKLGDFVEIGTGATPNTANVEYYNGKIAWVTSASTNRLFISQADKFISDLALEETNCRIYPKHTLIVAMYGQGKTRGQVSELLIEAATNQACAAIIFDQSTIHCKDYIKLFFQKIYDEIRETAASGPQPNLNVQKIKNILVPLPPLSEQKRIVEKVSQLMKFCDELENDIKKNQQNSELLMEATLKEAFVVD